MKVLRVDEVVDDDLAVFGRMCRDVDDVPDHPVSVIVRPITAPPWLPSGLHVPTPARCRGDWSPRRLCGGRSAWMASSSAFMAWRDSCDSGLSAQPFIAEVQQGFAVWCRRTGRSTCMNSSNSTKDLTRPTDGVLLWWLSPNLWADCVDGFDHKSVWWCHRCEKSFNGEGVKQIEMAAWWLADQTNGRRHPLQRIV
jgi:hypothetical protein